MTLELNLASTRPLAALLLALLLAVAGPVQADERSAGDVSHGLSSRVPSVPVERQQGWMPGKDLRFGEYWTEQYKTGAARSSSKTSGTAYRAEARAELRFEQFGPGGVKAAVQASSELVRTEKRPVVEFGNGALGSVLGWLRTDVIEDRNSFNGRISIDAGSSPREWTFALSQPDESSRNKPDVGVVNGPAGEAWRVVALHAPLDRPSDPRMPAMDMPRVHLGLEVFDEQGTVGAVLNTRLREEVWLSERLSAEQRLALASVFSAVLGRRPLTLPGKT